MQKHRRGKVWKTENVYSNNFQEMSIKQKWSEIKLDITDVYIEIPHTLI